MWGGEGAARGSSVLTSCRVQANPPKWRGRGCLERWLSANSVCLTLLSGKTCSPLVFAYLTGGVNSLVLVTQLVLWTAVPGCVRTNYKLMWVVKYGFPNFLFFLRNKSLFKCKVWCGSFLINTVFLLLGQLLSAEKMCTGGLTSKTQKAV